MTITNGKYSYDGAITGIPQSELAKLKYTKTSKQTTSSVKPVLIMGNKVTSLFYNPETEQTYDVTGTGGEMGKLIVTYEDKSGNVTTLEENFSISVNAPVYTDIEKVKDVQKKDYSKMIIEIVVAVVVAAFIVIWIIRRRKRKKEILEEF